VPRAGHFHRHDAGDRDRALGRVKATARLVAVGATASTGVLIALAFHETPNHAKPSLASAAPVSPPTAVSTPSSESPSTTSPSSGVSSPSSTGASSALAPPTTVPSAPVTTAPPPQRRVVTGPT
jgi:hypothetical protein